MNSLDDLKKELKLNADSKKAEASLRFFKTGKGEYSEGQKFLGISTPVKRKIAKRYTNLNLIDLQKLLNSKIHDYRFIALIILINKFQKSGTSDVPQKEKIFDFYIRNSKNINNWDLVDISAPHIAGKYLLQTLDVCGDRRVLYKLAKSKNLWEKRIAIVSTYAFIREGDFEETLKISEILLNDEHDLIHKAVGWMLREVGNRDRKIEEKFLKRYYKKMPRTMLRYSIEKFPESLRQRYLRGEI